jgi:hypothetical protein
MAKERIDPDYEKWEKAIALYDKEFEAWAKRTQKILKIYRRETNAIVRQTPAKFNILWSNVQTLVPAVYSRLPRPDVSRKFKDNDPVGRVASQILERALECDIQNYPDFRTTLEQNVYDRFLGGRGTSWIRYEPHFAMEPAEPVDGLNVTSTTDEIPQVESLKYECCPIDYVHWRDFGFTVCRTWDEVTAVWRRVYMTRDALVERFGKELGGKIPLDSKPPDLRQQRPYGSDAMDARGLIFEIWDKENSTAIWLSKSLGKILDERLDPLELPEFFPCPKPLLATTTTDSLVPIPDYVLYEDQAKSLDTLADRISGLIEALKVRGCYDAATPELARLFSEGENNALIPVNNWAAFVEKSGLKGAIDLVDITIFGQALQQAYQAFDQVKAQIYEIIGLSDIMRAVSDPNETLGAQQLKAHFGGNRLMAYQNEVAQYATDILRLKAHVICTKFSQQSIMTMADVNNFSDADKPLIPQALELLKCDPCRSFRIDIEADSMVQIDEETDKQSRMEFLNAVSGFLKETVNGAAGNPQLAPLMVSMLEFGVRGFKIGKELEGEIDQAMEQMKAKAQQPAPPPIELQKLQAEGQQHAAEMQQQAQFKQQEAQIEVWKAQQIQEAQARDTQIQQQLEAAREQQRQQFEQQIEMVRVANDKRMAEMQSQVALMKAMIDERRAIQVAQIAAGTVESHEQVAAADQSVQMQGIMQALAESHQQLALQFASMNGPKKKTVVRDQTGRISHVIEEPTQVQ